MDSSAPQQLGNYQLIKLLGQGGFATVYLGKHIHLKSLAAVKILHSRLADEGLVSLFRQEATIIAALSHPHIVRVLDFDVEGDTAFFIMDYAPDGTLREQHKPGTIVPLADIVSYVKQIASALQYAHNHHVIHRDVKPENMLIKDGSILVSDFGLAVLSSENSSRQLTQDTAGTIAYMAPEQINGKPRAASDQYSLAIVVYEWLCGRRPFNGNIGQVTAQHLSATPPPLHSIVPNISREIEEVVFKALAKDPRDRFPTVEDFATALQDVAPMKSAFQRRSTIPPAASSRDLASVRTIRQPRSTYTQQVSKRPRLLPRRAIVLGMVGLASVGVAGLIYAATQNQPTTATIAQQPQAMTTPSSNTSPVIQPTPTDQATATTQAQASPTTKQATPTQQPAPTQNTTPIGTLLSAYHGHTSTVYSVAWSPDGRRIASGGLDQTVQVWDAATGRSILAYSGHTSSVNYVAWSPDGTKIASGSDDSTVQVWNAITGNLLYICRHDGNVHGVAWSPDGKRIASGSGDMTVRIWDATIGTQLMVNRDHITTVWGIAWSPDGTKIASASGNTAIDNTVKIWDLTTGGSTITYTGHASSVFYVAWSPDGRRIASGSADSTVQIWNANPGQTQLTYRNHTAPVYGVVWSPGGHRVASGSTDSTVQVCDATTGATLFTYRGHTDSVFGVAWSPDGQHLASGSNDHTVQVWQAL